MMAQVGHLRAIGGAVLDTQSGVDWSAGSQGTSTRCRSRPCAGGRVERHGAALVVDEHHLARLHAVLVADPCAVRFALAGRQQKKQKNDTARSNAVLATWSAAHDAQGHCSCNRTCSGRHAW